MPHTDASARFPFILLAAATLAAGCEPAPEADDGAGSQATRLSLADSLATWYALGIGAHHLCAGTFVVGRDLERSPEEVLDQDVRPFPQFRWQEDFDADVDPASGTVTVGASGIGERQARYAGKQGCAILPAGQTDVHFARERVAPELPPPGEQDWPTGDRGAEAELDPRVRATLDEALDHAFDDEGRDRPQNTRGVVVVHEGRIAAERYAPGWGPYTPQISWSMGKSLASALTGVLVEQGEFALEDPAPVPFWAGARDPRREIRVADLLRMSSGLDFDNFGLDPESSYTAANEHFRIYFDAVDAAAHAVHQPLRFEPGSTWRYRNSDPLTLMFMAREAVEARGESFLAFPQRHLFDRIGIRSMVLETDPWGNFLITGYDFGGSRDWARFGLLHLWDGVWEGEQILPEGWVEFVRTPAPGDPSEGYGGLFWLNRGGAMESLPADAFWAAGYMGQYTIVIPSRDLVVVRQGPSSGAAARYFEELVREVLQALESGGG